MEKSTDTPTPAEAETATTKSSALVALRSRATLVVAKAVTGAQVLLSASAAKLMRVSDKLGVVAAKLAPLPAEETASEPSTMLHELSPVDEPSAAAAS